MMKKIIFVSMVVMMFLNTGCTSYVSARYSQEERARARIMKVQDKKAMEALDIGISPTVAIKSIQLDNGVGIGVDLFSLDTITQNPLRQTGAALLDALLTWGTYEAIKYIRDQTGSIDTNNINITVNCNCK